MKLTFFSNACCIYESEGYRLLADPWLSETAFEGAWVHDPPITTKPEDVTDVDALYISHIHPDHCDPQTLKYFRRDIPILTLRDEFLFCANYLERLGFTNVIALPNRASAELGPFTVTMFGPFVAHPFHENELGNLVDSSLLVQRGKYSVLNCNDNTPSIESAAQLKRDFGSPTVAQINYNNAGPYPACFMNLSLEEKASESERLIKRNLDHLAAVGKALGAKFVQPFAGAFKLAGDKAHLNPYLGTCSDVDAAFFLQLQGFEPVLLGENEAIDLEDWER